MSSFEPLFDSSAESSEFEPLAQSGPSEFQAFDFVRGADAITVPDGTADSSGGEADATFPGPEGPGSELEGSGGSVGRDFVGTQVDGAEGEDSGAVSGEAIAGDPSLSIPGLSLADSTEGDSVDPIMDAVRLEARETGLEEGRAQGLEEMKQQLQSVQDILEQVEGLRAEFFARAVQDVGTTIIQIVEQVIRRELSVSSGDVEGLVTRILHDVQTSDGFVIRVAEEDAESLRAARPTLLQLVGRDTALRIEVDDRLLAGGAVVETSFGSIDASVSTQMEAFVQTVQAWMDQEVEANDD
ncbi:MAG: FliH/SctL family protein [Myxococcota bacterium]|nr:FliH/SctL family protein [Myxococcota bacterium]